MFDPNTSNAPTSLLMRARQNAKTASDPDSTGEPLRPARSSRHGQGRNRLLAGLAAANANEATAEPTAADRPIEEAGTRRSRKAPASGRDTPASPRQTGQRDGPDDHTGRNAIATSDHSGGNGSLLDPIELAGAIWRRRWGVVACTLIGAAVGVIVATSSPTRFTAVSEILMDPRELNLIERDLEREFLANEAALAIIDSRLSLVTARPVLERVIEQTNLDQDPEFNGTGGPGGGLLDQLSLFTAPAGEPRAAAAQSRATLESLRSAISIDRRTRTFVVDIGVESESPQKAALLANAVTDAFIAQQSAVSAERAGEANAALTERLATLQADAETAERRLAAFRADNGLIQTEGRLVTEDELTLATAQLSEARAATIQARSRAEAAQASTVEAVIDGSLPNDLVTPALTTFREQFASLRQGAAQLETQLGPLHPRLNSAQASVDSARQDIAAELRRIVAGTQSELRQAVQAEQETAAQVARAKAAISNQGEAVVTLRDLESDARAARAIYDGALLRARETGEIEALGTINATVLAQAEAPLDPSSPSRRAIAAGFTVAGFIIGMGLAVLAGLVASLRPNGRTDTADDGPAPSSPDDRRSPRKPKRDSNAMYPTYPPHPTQPAPQQPMAAQPPVAVPQPHPAPQPAYGYGAQPPAYPAAPPQPVMAQQPAYAPAPAPAAMAYAPYTPAPTVAAFAPAAPAGAWPQPSPYATPQVAPVPVAPPAYPAPSRAAPYHEAEMEALRQSVREIREVLDEMTSRRDNVRRFG